MLSSEDFTFEESNPQEEKRTREIKNYKNAFANYLFSRRTNELFESMITLPPFTSTS